MKEDDLIEIRKLSGLSDAEVNGVLGRSIRRITLGGLPENASDEEIGRSYVRKFLDQHRASICSDEKIKNFAKNNYPAAAENLIAAVFDIASRYIGGIPLFAISVLILKTGLNRLCSDEWECDSNPQS